ncbi:hypothetical protein JDV02_002258 [Purpureocillium takamizusanense]|uniref:Thioester reductase (TE) domain-containing protein n=1 Tax=Purpureocillium takamizusanense TaxID=2060973 RepID=A0A9Q8V8F7_9HYPO|nr:uncharacterized protein JDV02_002258 [Purpureocillium takamizusanense]UNI15752.1 hypothetical protein JDV02_002258 [Purpureocillium takamizusanense]
MEDLLSRLASGLRNHIDGPLNILEMGAGTGGTIRWVVSLLASLDPPVEYTFTDLDSSFCVLTRKKFGRNLYESARNIRKPLRPDGFLLMVEMTTPMYWVDMIFGLLEGWWLFDDGRTHAVADENRWARDLQSAAYGHVNWTDGQREEKGLQKLIIAMASGPRQRQVDSFESKGIDSPQDCLEKFLVWETDLSKPRLGLAAVDYEALLGETTHIIHNVWLMNARWPVKRFEPQFQILRNLLDAGLTMSKRGRGKAGFLFVSFIATVGHWPLHMNNPNVPEERVTIERCTDTPNGSMP